MRRIAAVPRTTPGDLMTDYDFPDTLIAAQRAYWDADRRVHELVATLPPSLEMTDEQHAELTRLRAARLEALEVRDQHPWWGGTGQRYVRQMALREAARGTAG
ncbi:hypothetical protein [Streptosporangium saharense]|uniref:hypothetical protein n=1 Tax=Streptosporangium saharense TaxID=1706840 RepID=UPI0033285E30